MNMQSAADRLTIESKIDCRNAKGDCWTVLRWRREVNESVDGEAAKWVATGPAVFTLFDASAVIQVSGSALQIVANGMLLHVVDQADPQSGHERARGAAPMFGEFAVA